MDDWVPGAGPSPDDRHASVNMSARMTKTSGARASSRQPKRLTPCRNRRHINDNPALRSDGDAVDGLAAGAIDGGEAQVLQQGGEGGGPFHHREGGADADPQAGAERYVPRGGRAAHAAPPAVEIVAP